VSPVGWPTFGELIRLAFRVGAGSCRFGRDSCAVVVLVASAVGGSEASRLGRDSVVSGMPMPTRDTASMRAGVLSETVRRPVAVPALSGVKLIRMEQARPGISEAGH